jgi:hypothetical protein
VGRTRTQRCRQIAKGTLLVLLSLGPVGSLAIAEDPPPAMDLELVVAHISEKPGRIDPRGQKLHEKLRQEFRYESLEVLESRRLTLRQDEVGRTRLPNGRMLLVRPLLVDGRGALLAVDWEETTKADLRVKSGQLVILGPQRYEDGKLVVSLEAHF